MIAAQMTGAAASVQTREMLLDYAQEHWGSAENLVLVMAGAGDIDLLVAPVKSILTK
jgi:hypothetical protein